MKQAFVPADNSVSTKIEIQQITCIHKVLSLAFLIQDRSADPQLTVRQVKELS